MRHHQGGTPMSRFDGFLFNARTFFHRLHSIHSAAWGYFGLSVVVMGIEVLFAWRAVLAWQYFLLQAHAGATVIQVFNITIFITVAILGFVVSTHWTGMLTRTAKMFGNKQKAPWLAWAGAIVVVFPIILFVAANDAAGILLIAYNPAAPNFSNFVINFFAILVHLHTVPARYWDGSLARGYTR